MLANVCSSLMSRIRKMASRVDADSAINSASDDESDISVCSLLDHTMGTPASMMMNPVLERAVFGSVIACCEFDFIHSPANDASTKTSRLRDGCGLMVSPISRVPRRYLPICFTAFPCDCLGSDMNLEH